MWMDLKMLLQVWELWRENGLFKKKKEVKIYWNSKILHDQENQPRWINRIQMWTWRSGTRDEKCKKMKMVNEFLYYGDFLAASQIASFLVDFR